MNILVVEDDPNRIAWFKNKISVGLDICTTAKDAVARVNSKKYDFIFLDHDLGGRVFVPSEDEETGYTVAKAIAESSNKNTDVIVHSMNPVGAENICRVLPQALRRPFGTFDLRQVDDDGQK